MLCDCGCGAVGHTIVGSGTGGMKGVRHCEKLRRSRSCCYQDKLDMRLQASQNYLDHG